jgi:hypothetical protein
MPDIEKCPAIMFMEEIRNRYDRREQKWNLGARKAVRLGPEFKVFPDKPAPSPVAFARVFSSQDIYAGGLAESLALS